MALLENSCGAIPEGENKTWYHVDRYNSEIGRVDLEAIIYLSDEVFDSESYNENSIKKESKINFQQVFWNESIVKLEL